MKEHSNDDKVKIGLSNYEASNGNYDDLEKRLKARLDAKSKQVPFDKHAWLLLLVLGLILLFFLFNRFNKKVHTDNQVLFAQYFDAPPLIFDITTRGNSTNEKISKENRMAIEAYQQNNFEDAVTLWNSHLENSNMLKDSILLYQGIASLADGHADAKKYLDQVTSAEIQDLKVWYKSLFFLKQGVEDSLYYYLIEITNSKNHFKKGDAETILKLLSK